MEAVGIRLFLPRLLLELGRLTSSSCPQTGVYTIGSPSFSGLGIRTALPHWLSGTGCRRQITVPLSHQGHVIQFLTINLLVCPSTPMCLSVPAIHPMFVLRLWTALSQPPATSAVPQEWAESPRGGEMQKGQVNVTWTAVKCHV